MQTINVQINIDSPTGRRLLEEVKRHPKVAKVQYPLIDNEKTYSIEEVFSKVEEKLNNHYDTNYKLKY
jgi:O-acetylhomoserine/O-acetylserine sulfhydrylase-like pyridoxal-dependent enzyme